MPHFEEYAFVTPKIGAFLGRATYCPQKMSEGERAERCAHQRVPPPPPRPRFGAIFRKISDFLHNFGVVKKCPPPRVEPNFAPIFPRDVTNMPGPYSFGARDSFLGPGFDLSPRKSKIVRGRGPARGTGFLGWAPPSLVRVVSLGPPVLARVVRLEWEILGSKCVGSGD